MLPEPPVAPPTHVEEGFWRSVSAAWRPLFGGFFNQGASVEWHDFHLESDLDWGRSFHPQSLEICLNFSGTASLTVGGSEHNVAAGQVAVYTVPAAPIAAVRRAGSLHRFVTLELSSGFLHDLIGGKPDLLKPGWRLFIEGKGKTASHLEVAPMSTALLALRNGLLEPPVPSMGRETWYLGKIMEIVSHLAFRSDAETELFCERHLRQSRERVERVRYLLERDLENPPSLEMLAKDVGCSPFHLSRIFAEQAGMSIPKFLRTRRIEVAAEHLRGGKMNVTQAAMAVGYSSLSAFNRAFVEQMGCCPGLYPVLKGSGRKAAR